MKSFKDFDKLVNEGNFIPLFRGENEYEFVCRHADVPTDWDIAVNFLCRYYESKGQNPKIAELCRCSLTEMAQKSAMDAWCALNVLYYLGCKDHRNRFDIITDELVENIKNGLLKHKEELKTTQKYMGKGSKNGLWSDTLCLTKIIKKYCDIEIKLNEK